MEQLNNLFRTAKKQYDSGNNPLTTLLQISKWCLGKLQRDATFQFQGKLKEKSYSVYKAGTRVSRPFLSELFYNEVDLFEQEWATLVASIQPEKTFIDCDPDLINAVIYTCSSSFALCFDLWKPTSRKTPGTFFEIVLGSLISILLPDYTRTKHVSLPDGKQSLSTDIVFIREGYNMGLVFPAKITTRERIVQPFAHQKILDSVFGDDRFVSILLCMSELQRNKDVGVNEICVPGTLILYQKHLAHLEGVYYLDPPIRYLQRDVTDVIAVNSIGHFLRGSLVELVELIEQR